MFDASFFLNMTAACCLIAGMFIIWKVFKEPLRGDTGTIRIFKRLEIKSRTLGMLFLGMILFGGPVFIASKFAVGSPLLLAASPDQHEGEIEINDPDLNAFVFRRDDSVLDLRGRPTTNSTSLISTLVPITSNIGQAQYLNTMTV